MTKILGQLDLIHLIIVERTKITRELNFLFSQNFSIITLSSVMVNLQGFFSFEIIFLRLLLIISPIFFGSLG